MSFNFVPPKLKNPLSITVLGLTLSVFGSIDSVIAQSEPVAPSGIQAAQQKYLGQWKTEAKGAEDKTATVEIMPCAENPVNLCGKIIAIAEPFYPGTQNPKLDEKNKNKDLRTREIVGIQIISDLKPKKNGGYANGEIYSPRTGKTYRASMKLSAKDDNVLNVKGHVFLFSQTQRWTRVQN